MSNDTYWEDDDNQVQSDSNGKDAMANIRAAKRADEKRIKELEGLAERLNQTQLFIETPYRNNKLMEDLLQILQPSTYLCIACDITLPTEYIKTKTVNEWKKEKADLHNRPCIFILHKM